MVRLLMTSAEGRLLLALVAAMALLAAALVVMIEAAMHDKEDEIYDCD